MFTACLYVSDSLQAIDRQPSTEINTKITSDSTTGPKMRFPTYSAFQNMTFPGISYMFLEEDRATLIFMQMNEIFRKFCPILQIFCMSEILIFIQCTSTI